MSIEDDMPFIHFNNKEIIKSVETVLNEATDEKFNQILILGLTIHDGFRTNWSGKMSIDRLKQFSKNLTIAISKLEKNVRD